MRRSIISRPAATSAQGAFAPPPPLWALFQPSGVVGPLELPEELELLEEEEELDELLDEDDELELLEDELLVTVNTAALLVEATGALFVNRLPL